MTVIHIKQT